MKWDNLNDLTNSLSSYNVGGIILGAGSFITSVIFTSLCTVLLFNYMLSHISDSGTDNYDLESVKKK